ncbi:MAG: serine protein kinase PrkA [bacterium]
MSKKRTPVNVDFALEMLHSKLIKRDYGSIITFKEFLQKVSSDPMLIFRNVFQLFNSMVYYYITEEDEYADDPENINFKTINTEQLLVKNTDTPFFADLPLANRILKLADSFKGGSQQNKIYVFIGPPGSGKSTFLNNLLQKFEEYTYLPQGITYEIFWQIDEAKLGPHLSSEIKEALEEYYTKVKQKKIASKPVKIEIPCPSHDHPILIIPKEHRAELLESLITGEEKIKIFNKKEYEWVFKKNACTICNSIYSALSSKLDSPADVFDMIFAKRFCYDRRLSNGISIYNPGDKEPEHIVFSNPALQESLTKILKDSTLVKYIYSRYAKTNNGVFALMDVKGQNEKRFLDLHGIISEGVHKIEDIEENVNSLFIALMNPEDRDKVMAKESFRDRITEINVNYILNYNEEVKIYCNAFGSQIRNRFLPGVLNNFAKIIISSRLNTESDALRKWIKNAKQYYKYCDENLLLLKLSIYNNKIPSYLSDEDRKSFSKEIRSELIDESESEGCRGFSGRESINIFDEFYNEVRKKFLETDGQKQHILITMDHITDFFDQNDQYSSKIPRGFINSIIHLYDYNVMQQIKKSLFQQNEERISRDIQNYLFALSYDAGEKLLCPYTQENIEINDQFYNSFEQHLLKKTATESERKKFRSELSSKFTINLQEMQVSDLHVTDTVIFKDLYGSYMKNLREHIFQPFLQYTSFENALKEYGTPKFEVFDNKTKEQVRFLITNLIKKFKYSKEGAIQVCLYVLNNKVAEKFSSS